MCNCVLLKFCFKALCSRLLRWTTFALCLINWFLKCQGWPWPEHQQGATSVQGHAWGSVIVGGYSVLSLWTALCLSLEPAQSGASGIDSWFSCDSHERRWFPRLWVGSVLALRSVQALLALLTWDFTIWQCHLEGINKAIVSRILLGLHIFSLSESIE